LFVRSTAERPAFAAGLRAAFATMVPLLIAQLLHLTGAGTWASLGGFSAAVADRGGAYRTRALTMGALTVGAALGVVLGGMVGANTWLAVALTFAVVGLLSLAREFGISAGGVGNSIAVAFVIAVSAPSPNLEEALSRGLYLLAGGAWAMILALVFWPLRPYRPLRFATARCYRDLADLAADVADLGGRAPNETQRLVIEQRKRALRDSIEAARSVVAVARRGGQGEVRRGERLLLLVQGAELLFGTLIAISESIESAAETSAVEVCQRLARALQRFAGAARQIATTIETEPHAPHVLEGISPALDSGSVDKVGGGAAAAHAARLLAQLAEYTTVVAANADALESGRLPNIPPALAVLTIVDDRPLVLETLRASLTWNSLAMRHALRVAIVTALAVLVTRILNLPRGYWVTITVLIILQPFAGATLIKTLQRVVGTVTGALLTASLVALVHDPRGLLVIVFVFAAVCVAFLRVNYLIYSIFLTPTFVLLAEMSAGDWHLAQLRALNTIIGGVLGLAGSWLLWPTPERDRFPELAAAALRAIANHLRVLTAMWTSTDDESSVALAAARRDAALALTNAEASFERMVAESAKNRHALEPGTTLLTFARRLISADIALGTLRHAPEAAAIGDDVRRFAGYLTSSLDCVAAAVAERRAPVDCAPPATAEPLHPELTLPQFHRVRRQLDIIIAAAKRLAAA
jgi:uncharacterized membrane protein YccC